MDCMDCLDDRTRRKDLDAFYAPPAYAREAAELVTRAVDDVPDGNDCIALDGRAGTSDPEGASPGSKDRNGDDVIRHCIVSALGCHGCKALVERLGDKVRAIVLGSEGGNRHVREKGMFATTADLGIACQRDDQARACETRNNGIHTCVHLVYVSLCSSPV